MAIKKGLVAKKKTIYITYLDLYTHPPSPFSNIVCKNRQTRSDLFHPSTGYCLLFLMLYIDCIEFEEYIGIIVLRGMWLIIAPFSTWIIADRFLHWWFYILFIIFAPFRVFEDGDFRPDCFQCCYSLYVRLILYHFACSSKVIFVAVDVLMSCNMYCFCYWFIWFLHLAVELCKEWI